MAPQALLPLLALCLATLGAVSAEKLDWVVGDVDSLNFCLPITVLVVPNESNETSIMVDGEPAVAQALSTTVEDGAMGLGLDKGFKTTKAVRVTVSVPATALKFIRNVGTGSVLLGEGFVSKELEVLNTGAGRIVARGVDVEKLLLKHTGAGGAPVFVEGKIGTAVVEVVGVGDIFVLGVEATASVAINGVSRVHVSGGPGLKVTGRINGVTDGVSTDGECNVKKMINLGSGGVCDPLDEDAIPDPVLTWACGLEVEGKQDCLNAKASTSAATSSSGNAMASAAATSGEEASKAESSPGGVDASGNAVAANDLKCMEDGDLKIES